MVLTGAIGLLGLHVILTSESLFERVIVRMHMRYRLMDGGGDEAWCP